MRERASARTRPWACAALLAILFAGCSGTAQNGASDRIHNEAAYDAWRTGRSHFEVTVGGSIARVLGTRVGRSGPHEGFLLHLSGAAGRGLTLRVEDNVDLTGPIPLQDGESAEVRGEYIFDPRGGLVHYTHRDPRGRHVAGYVLVGDKFYQ